MRANRLFYIHVYPVFIAITFSLLITCRENSTVKNHVGKGRVTISLNGSWQIEDCISESGKPSEFTHVVPVPGLVNLASPPFENAGKFTSRDVANHPLYKNPDLPPKAKIAPVGVSLQVSNYFWYKKSFTAPAKKQVAILKINKAQFGTDVWLNGKKIGNHDGCFTSGYFDLTEAINWDARESYIHTCRSSPGSIAT